MAKGTAELERFVREAMAQGHKREGISAALLSAGWTQEQIADTLDDYADVNFPIPVPKPRASLSAREAFEYLVLFATLYFAIFHLGSLLFDLIDHLFPDPAVMGMGSMGREGVSQFSIASVIIAFPLFAWLASRQSKAVRKQPILRLSPVRRWLTYLTLFIAATALIGDLTALVYRLLSGETSLRFLLKVLVVAALAGSIFGYYLWELRREEVSSTGGRQFGRSLLLTGAAVAVLAVVSGIFVTGGPGFQREVRMDGRRAMDLSDISRAIESHYGSEGALPTSLAVLAAKPGIELSIQDPLTGAPYGYEAKAQGRYRLCADFATDTKDLRVRRLVWMSSNWPHPRGRHCFDRQIESVAEAARKSQAAAQAAPAQ